MDLEFTEFISYKLRRVWKEETRSKNQDSLKVNKMFFENSQGCY